jgi:hypothetical protein
MKKLILSSIFVVMGLALSSQAQTGKPTVWTVKSVANTTVSIDGSLKTGIKLKDLSWAWNSANACFPGTQQAKFTGNHVFYVTELPPHSILTVTVKPKNGGTDLSIYGYQIGAGKITLPEDLHSCVTCEADHKWDYPKRGKTQGDERTMTFNAIGNSYNVVVGVTGPNGAISGDFTLSFALKQ